jgi:hypothetical protein
MLAVYSTWKRYQLHYGMDEHGRLQQGAATSDDEDSGHDKDEDGCQTRFEGKRKLKVFMDHIVMGKPDQPFTHMARHTSSATNLDLGYVDMKYVQQLISEIWALYKTDFPNTSDSNSAALPSTELQVPLLIAGEYTPAHVKASNSIESEEEYHATLSAYQEQCRKLLEESTMEYIELRIAFVTESPPDDAQEVGSCLFHAGAWSQVVNLR